MATRGWMNDPCGLGFDPVSKLYRVAFQWNPNGNDWGNISWGSATSTNLISWEIAPSPCLTPDAPYDRCGVFSGCLVQPGISGTQEHMLTYFYTSASHCPIHYTLPYSYGSESLSMATSFDGGRTWRKHTDNPLLPGPPAGITVTGWRDPHVSPWPALSKLLGKATDNPLFGVIAGGIRDRGPTAFLYSIDANDLTTWKYLGPLANAGTNDYRSRWSGDLGVNWEVVNFLTLTDDATQRSSNFLIMGGEGCQPHPHELSSTVVRSGSVQRTLRNQFWVGGDFNKFFWSRPEEALISRDFGGILDHGCLYAANSFWDPTVNSQVFMGWVTEDDLPDDVRHTQGWSGLLSLPRLLGLMVLNRVKRAHVSPLKSITSVQVTPDANGSSTIVTLKIVPHPRLTQLRSSAALSRIQPLDLVSTKDGTLQHQPHLSISSVCWEFELHLAVSTHCKKAGFEIGFSEGKFLEYTFPTTGRPY